MKAAIDRRWYVVRTNIKCEERAVKSLRAAKYRVYLPVMKKDVFQRRQKVMTTRKFVLFNRYLFVGMPAENPDWFTLRACDGVESVLGINGTPIPVSRKEVAKFMLAQRRGAFNDLQQVTKKGTAKKRFAIGSGLRVRGTGIDHPFGGFYGQVVEVTGRGTVKAMMKLFGGLTPCEFQLEDIEPAVDFIPKAA